MPKSSNSKLTGQIIGLNIGDGLNSNIDEEYWVDIGLKTPEGNVVNINYKFLRESIRDNLFQVLKNGMNVTIYVDGQVSLDQRFSYSGKGSVQIHDLSKELSHLVEDKLNISKNDYFSDFEAEVINRILLQAKNKIVEEFNPDNKTKNKIDEHLESLASQTHKVTKFDWKKLFISCVVSISIDLGLGANIPISLFNLFRKLFEEFIVHRLVAPKNG